MNRRILPAAVLAAALTPASAATPRGAGEQIVITVTRQPEPDIGVPAAETVISGDDIRARGATDLRGALRPAAGVEALPGSDGGPASSVVAFQGLTELDAYMLVVDGVPFGGAFNPATATFDPIDVDRIEVVRGAAPVTYGATSFVGIINVIRPEAGQQPTRAMLQAGTRDSGRAAFATNLSSATFGQSLLGSLETRKFSQDRGKFSRGHLLYRAATDLGGGRLHFDLEGVKLDQTPYSPHPREGTGLSDRFPLDSNINPRDARADQDRLQGKLGFDTGLGGGVQWSSMLSAARTWSRNTKGFLRTDFDATGATSNADGFRQRVRMTDIYADTHVGRTGSVIDWTFGADWLYGQGSQHSANFEYAVLPDGSNAPNSRSLNIDESTVLNDRRSFGGIYGQIVARPVPALTLLGGLRLNRTSERRCGGEAAGSAIPEADECQSRKKTRLAGSAGASFAVLRSDRATVSAFADYRNTYKPAAIDFGPEAEPDILAPETASSWEAGFKAASHDGRLHAEVSYFDTRFNNLVIRENIDELPGLANAGKERFRGVEGEVRWVPLESLTIEASYAHHIARFTDYERLRPDGSLQQLAGKRLELSPKDLATGIATYTPAAGFQASATLRYVGSRFLNKTNTVKSGAYATLDARAGWKFAKGWGVFVEGENLTDRRDPVTESELGDAQFYRLPGRRIFATLSYKY
ncbi:MAG: TonB-dependent receptor [Sphingomicrobium sp.]